MANSYIDFGLFVKEIMEPIIDGKVNYAQISHEVSWLVGPPECDKCNAECCKYFLNIELTSDEKKRFKTRNGFLKRKNGKCVYCSDENKCNVYDHRPKTCRGYDCRVTEMFGSKIKNSPELVIKVEGERNQFMFAVHESVMAEILLTYPNEIKMISEKDGMLSYRFIVSMYPEILKRTYPFMKLARKKFEEMTKGMSESQMNEIFEETKTIREDIVGKLNEFYHS